MTSRARWLRPVDGCAITQWFGENPGDYPEYGGHPGVDYGCPSGTPVVATAAGVVLLAGTDPAYPGRGIHVVIDHPEGLRSYYMHLSTALVLPGQQVEAGRLLGLSGNTGFSTGPHLHWGVRDMDNLSNERQGFIDPTPLLAD